MSLERIEITPFAVIAGEILQQRRTGSLTIVHAPLRRNLYWAQGELALITSTSPGGFACRLPRAPRRDDRATARCRSRPPIRSTPRRGSTSPVCSTCPSRQTLLREWMTSLFIPLFSLDEGTAAFTDDEAIEPEQARVPAVDCRRSCSTASARITNGLVLRRSLGDLKRDDRAGSRQPRSRSTRSRSPMPNGRSPRRCTSRRRSRRF